MNIHIFQHVHFEGEGLIREWAKSNGAQLTHTRFYEKVEFPNHHIDLLVIMGGPMGVYDEAEFPWLADEEAFIKTALNQGTKIMGVCLGAQLLAHALGAQVKANKVKEIGWFPVQLTVNHHSLFEKFGDNASLPVLHWHGDTFDTPTNAIHVLSSDACTNQAFVYKQQAVALQFHLEMTRQNLELLIENAGTELIPSSTVQTAIELKKGLMQYHDNCKLLMFDLLNKFALNNN
jgi:GMP synthase-like glutamine amidotransferase